MKTPSILLSALLLAGCAGVGPQYSRPATAVPDDWQHWHGGSAQLRETGIAAGQAYARFDDPVLRQLLHRAAQANHDVRAAALRFAQSRVQRDVAAAAGRPRLDAQAGVARQRQSETGAATRMLDALAPAAERDRLTGILAGPFGLWQAGFDASWEPDLWGRVRHSVEAAEADAAQAAALQWQVRLAIAVEVARNYYEVRTARAQLQLARADLAAGEELLQLARLRSGNGLATDFDVARQEAQLAEQRGTLPGLLEQEAQAENRLTLLLDRPPGAVRDMVPMPDDVTPLGPAPDLALGVPGELLARRPDIAAAEAALRAATARIGIARAGLYPRITLGLSFGAESVAAGRFGEWGSRQWSVGPGLSLPLFDGGVRRATVTLRELDQQEAAVAWHQAVLRAWHEADDALSAYAAERARRESASQREQAARTALELATVRYRQGLSDALPLLDAQRTLLAARRDRVRSEAALAVRLLAICKATGVMPQA
ncbi:efflux transporter outer membrane subunit [Pseudoduganella sp. SL102]|uniref:efflux transporter outer membrane subunit n=1 Tax=Pseudoduganella sp. SL102 TaxID=2995154 RepID=UPI00248B6BA9|nr:efflux transporter outer membrane subunit [Pseudoduganella sp. SL102]WBS03931.1 efflux transporter outer membrane subunit [Pseudoduganella sp. SL102]